MASLEESTERTRFFDEFSLCFIGNFARRILSRETEFVEYNGETYKVNNKFIQEKIGLNGEPFTLNCWVREIYITGREKPVVLSRTYYQE
jgi:hypothetical protein